MNLVHEKDNFWAYPCLGAIQCLEDTDSPCHECWYPTNLEFLKILPKCNYLKCTEIAIQHSHLWEWENIEFQMTKLPNMFALAMNILSLIYGFAGIVIFNCDLILLLYLTFFCPQKVLIVCSINCWNNTSGDISEWRKMTWSKLFSFWFFWIEFYKNTNTNVSFSLL